ncbi:MAG: hypothetical protein AAF322_14150 [Pseudomonadota bacterium]
MRAMHGGQGRGGRICTRMGRNKAQPRDGELKANRVALLAGEVRRQRPGLDPGLVVTAVVVGEGQSPGP